MISLAYITKNEEKYIERSIKSARSIADEIIVLDAFSEDNTITICKNLDAKIHQEEWKDDFSYSRNKLISMCNEDWILMLDADEHLEGENLDLIKHAISNSLINNIVGWQLPRKNHYPSHDHDSPYYDYPFFPDLQLRLFKKDPKIFFTGKVHEGVQQAIEVGNVGEIGRVSVFIHHHMFRGDKDIFESKKEEYYKKIQEGEKNEQKLETC